MIVDHKSGLGYYDYENKFHTLHCLLKLTSLGIYRYLIVLAECIKWLESQQTSFVIILYNTSLSSSHIYIPQHIRNSHTTVYRVAKDSILYTG